MRLFREMPPVMDVSSKGLIRPQARTLVGFRPIPGALVTLRDMDGTILEQARTDESGNAPLLEVPTPPLEYSLEPDSPQPYAQYTLTLEGEGVQTVTVEGTQVLPGEITLQQLTAIDTATADLVSPVPVADETLITIGPSTLYGNYPPKEPEASVKPLNPDDGFVVLNEVVIPEYIVVHDGTPSSNAQNYWIPYASYIANVASSEIYCTWEEAAITANVLAILSFTLNRVYTEWYRSKGYDFTITSSTAYDHKFIYGRSIYENIARVVDSVLTNYVTRPGVEQPLLTQYCDGRQVSCPNWMPYCLKDTLLSFFRQNSHRQTIPIPLSIPIPPKRTSRVSPVSGFSVCGAYLGYSTTSSSHPLPSAFVCGRPINRGCILPATSPCCSNRYTPGSASKESCPFSSNSICETGLCSFAMGNTLVMNSFVSSICTSSLDMASSYASSHVYLSVFSSHWAIR